MLLDCWNDLQRKILERSVGYQVIWGLREAFVRSKLLLVTAALR
jgi:hypothetical protein